MWFSRDQIQVHSLLELQQRQEKTNTCGQASHLTSISPTLPWTTQIIRVDWCRNFRLEYDHPTDSKSTNPVVSCLLLPGTNLPSADSGWCLTLSKSVVSHEQCLYKKSRLFRLIRNRLASRSSMSVWVSILRRSPKHFLNVAWTLPETVLKLRSWETTFFSQSQTLKMPEKDKRWPDLGSFFFLSRMTILPTRKARSAQNENNYFCGHE